MVEPRLADYRIAAQRCVGLPIHTQHTLVREIMSIDIMNNKALLIIRIYTSMTKFYLEKQKIQVYTCLSMLFLKEVDYKIRDTVKYYYYTL